MIHATRPFILNDFTDLTRRPLVPLDLVATHVHNCIDAARDVMQRVDALAGQGVMMESFWFTHYVCFCAIIVAYIYTIQQHQSSNDPNSPAVSSPADEVQDLFTLAENCQFHLARATQKNCPSRRYSFILEELRLEVHRQLGSPTQPHPDVLRLSDGEARERLAEDSIKPREGETETSQSSTNLTDNMIFEPYLGNAAAPNLVGTSDAIGNDFTFLDSLDGSVWWTQLDSWVSSQNANIDDWTNREYAGLLKYEQRAIWGKFLTLIRNQVYVSMPHSKYSELPYSTIYFHNVIISCMNRSSILHCTSTYPQ
jgi:hypothetical protein